MTSEEQILICAVRYALGRQSYIVGVVAEYVAIKINKLSEHCIAILIRDIEEEIEFYHRMNQTCGMEMDERKWYNLLEVLKNGVTSGNDGVKGGKMHD